MIDKNKMIEIIKNAEAALKEYTGATYTKAEDMYKCYDLAKLLNKNLTPDSYKSIIDGITKTTNYVQHVVLHEGKPISMVATQDNLNMSKAPRLSCKVDNIATLPEHRGSVTRLLLGMVKEKFKGLGYDNLNLCVTKGNERAVNFYKKTGFVQVSDSWTMRIKQEDKLISKL